MASNELTGVERQLVLDYLAKGNTSLTIAPVDSVSPVLFPVAVRAEQTRVLEQGIILLTASSLNLRSFEGATVKVQFYYNKLGLYFTTKMQRTSGGLALVIPPRITKIEDKTQSKTNEFTALLYYETGKSAASFETSESKINAECVCHKDFALFSEPDWNKCLERYLSGTGDEKTISSLENRVHAPDVIFLNHERIIFASKKSDMILRSECEYAVSLKFPLPGPLKERRVFTTCFVEDVSESYDRTRLCANARFTSLKEEDERFLSEKMS